ncbi:phosphoadenylyl-sulfate reductase [Bacillus badius]|uniref:phosphoadenylyl-sulfate reductase n=1 Tax=Bacillus badius TaxID=1455 RepID=UPI00399D4DED
MGEKLVAEPLTYEQWDDKKAREVLEGQSDSLDVLKWAFHEYGQDIVYACSFGAEGIVLIDLIAKVNKQAEIVFLDTGLHFPETYELIDKVQERYPSLFIKKVKPAMTVQEQAEEHGEELWKRDPNLCCHLRKVAPLQEALKDAKAWISGLRREQSPSRSHVEYINKDEKFHKIKVCPLIHWTWEEIMTYLHVHQLPYNPLHDKGFPSIGCTPCTEAISGNEGPRSGRWAGRPKTECGLHQD